LQATIHHHDFENPRRDEAIASYQKAIELNPTSKEYRLALVDGYMGKAFDLFGDAEGQASYYRRAIEVCDFVTNEMESDNYPEDWIAGVYEKKGICYGTLQDYEQAIQNYDMARLMSPRYSHLLTTMAQIKADILNDAEGALAYLNEYVEYCESNKGNTVFENTLAEAYYHRGKLKVAHLNQKEAGLQDLAQALEYENSDFYREEYELVKQA
jgi:tetratricopeptide (TPR) repeat protein